MARQICKEVHFNIEKQPVWVDILLRGRIDSCLGAIINIRADGFAGMNTKEFIQFLSIVPISCDGLRSQLYSDLHTYGIEQASFETNLQRVLLGERKKRFHGLLDKISVQRFKKEAMPLIIKL